MGRQPKAEWGAKNWTRGPSCNFFFLLLFFLERVALFPRGYTKLLEVETNALKISHAPKFSIDVLLCIRHRSFPGHNNRPGLHIPQANEVIHIHTKHHFHFILFNAHAEGRGNGNRQRWWLQDGQSIVLVRQRSLNCKVIGYKLYSMP